MTAEISSTISTILFVLAGVSFLLTVMLWFLFRISSVIGDLTGRTAKKTIAKMRMENETAMFQNYSFEIGRRVDAADQDSPQIAEKTSETPLELPLSTNEPASATMPETGLLAENKAVDTGTEITELFNETSEMPENEATALLADNNAAVPEIALQHESKRPCRKKLVMLDEVMLINTDEVI